MTTPMDFDYSGPPANVSNGMALQLVSQFGVRSAWHAFLRMRGMKLSNDDANRAIESYTYFRNKIGHLRRRLKDLEADEKQHEEKDELMSANFDTFLKAPDSLELSQEVDFYSEVDESEFVQEDNEKRSSDGNNGKVEPATKEDSSDQSAAASAAALLKVIKEQQQKINEQKKGDDNRKETGSNDSPSGKAKKAGLVEDDGTKLAQHQTDGRKEEIARRHAETIDDVVSLVMEKIRNNQPFEGELNMASAGTQVHSPGATSRIQSGMTPKGQKSGQKPTLSGNAGKRGVREAQLMENAYGGHGTLQQQQQQHNITSPTANNFSNLPPNQSFVLLHGPNGVQHVSHQSPFVSPPPSSIQQTGRNDPQTTILSNFSEIIRSSTSTVPAPGYPTHHQMTGTQAAPPAIATNRLAAQKGVQLQQHHQHIPVTSSHMMHTHPLHHAQIVHPQQQQQQPLVLGSESSAELVVNGSGIPLDLAIQQGMTVQELLQTLKAQSRQQTSQIILQQPANALHMHQHQQQETPDSSSQEATQLEAQKLIAAKPQIGNGGTLKKGRKRKGTTVESEGTGEVHVEGPPKTKKQQKGKQQLGIGEKEEEEANSVKKLEEMKDEEGDEHNRTKNLKKRAAKGRKPAKQDSPSEHQTTSTSLQASPQKENNSQQNEGLDAQLKRSQKQLTAERNKVSAQKKRADKLQTELDKALDSIQLLQIDLACQKTDNNNLIAENIALKAENQQLRSKGATSAHRTAHASTAATSSETTHKSGGRGRKKGSGRGRKAREETPQEKVPEKARTPPPLSTELGRRQSKRICVARSQFMKTFY